MSGGAYPRFVDAMSPGRFVHSVYVGVGWGLEGGVTTAMEGILIFITAIVCNSFKTKF